MAFIKCSGGGKLRETILWTNPSPTSAFTASTGMCAIPSNSLYIKIYYTFSVNTQTQISNIIFETLEYKNFYSGYGANWFLGFMGAKIGSSGYVYRKLSYNNANNLIAIGGASSDNNKHIIPIKITSMKY
jgi:hypothetical protein